MRVQEWLARASQRVQELDNTPGFALSGESLIALQRRFVGLVRRQPTCGAMARRVIVKSAPPEFEGLTGAASVYAAVDGSGLHFMVPDSDASDDSLHGAQPPPVGSGIMSGGAAVGGAGAAALPPSTASYWARDGEGVDSDLAAIAPAPKLQILYSLPLRCLRRWGYTAISGMLAIDVMPELMGELTRPVRLVVRDGDIRKVELTMPEGQTLAAREFEARLTATAKARQATAEELGLDAFTWRRV